MLPLHHIHGIVNAILTPLVAGSTIEFLFPFNALSVWTRLATPFMENLNSDMSRGPTPAVANTVLPLAHQRPITFLTTVPTIYTRLLSTFETLPADLAVAAKKSITPANLRLPISGSAALPLPVRTAWTDLSSRNILLERYGMTETGMVLSCGLCYSDRVDGSVGWPLPGVEVRLVDLDTGETIEDGAEIDATGRERDGEIWVRGSGVFEGYWKNPQATEADFATDQDGKRWFKTGDVAVRRSASPEEPKGRSQDAEIESVRGQEWTVGKMYFIRGRKSADIIKSGGEKVSALEVEREILSLPEIEEVAVVAIPSNAWGQKVGAAVVLRPPTSQSAADPADEEDPSLPSESPARNTEQSASPATTDDTQAIGAIVVLKPHTEGRRGGPDSWGAMDLRRALRDRLAAYKIPRVVRVVKGIPRNAMGKSKFKIPIRVF